MYDKNSENLNIFNSKPDIPNNQSHSSNQTSNNNVLGTTPVTFEHQNNSTNKQDNVLSSTPAPINNSPLSSTPANFSAVPESNKDNLEKDPNSFSSYLESNHNSNIPNSLETNNIEPEHNINSSWNNTTNAEDNTNLQPETRISAVNPPLSTVAAPIPEANNKEVPIENNAIPPVAAPSIDPNNKHENSNQITTASSQFSQENNSFTKEDNRYLEAYIGNNYKKIISGKFSIPAFFLTSLYLFYRKQYLAGLILAIFQFIIVSVINNLSISSIIIIIIAILLGMFFNKLYIKVAMTNIEKIKAQNSNNYQNILTKCTLKGGTSISKAILLSLLVFVIEVIVMITIFSASIFNAFKDGIDIEGSINGLHIRQDSSNNDNGLVYQFQDINLVINNFNFTIPSAFSQKRNSYVAEIGDGTFNECEFSFQAIANYKDLNTMIDDMTDYYNVEASSSQINNITWYDLTTSDSLGTTYYHLTEKSGIIYMVTYEIGSHCDRAACDSYYSQIINSISYK